VNKQSRRIAACIYEIRVRTLASLRLDRDFAMLEKVQVNTI
jgi:hypothetical protein